MAYIGVDLHSNSFTICRLEEDGKTRFQTFALTPQNLDRFCLSLSADDEIAVEACSNSRFFKDWVRPCVTRVVVVDPSNFHVIRKSVSKTDNNDARALATFLSKDLLPQSRDKTRLEEAVGSMTQTRDSLVKQRTKILNKIHALFNREGIKIKKERLTYKKALRELDMDLLPQWQRLEGTILRDLVLRLFDDIAALEKHIKQAASDMPGYESLISIKGIACNSTAIFLATIGDVHDFKTADKLAAYLGIVPKVRRSNMTDIPGRITRRGNKLARTTLVQCTLVAIKYSPFLKDYYQRLKAKKGAGKAIIATARKFLTIIYNTLKNGWVFTDFTKYEKTAQPTA